MDAIHTPLGPALPKAAEFTGTGHVTIARQTPRPRIAPVHSRQGRHRTVRKLNS